RSGLRPELVDHCPPRAEPLHHYPRRERLQCSMHVGNTRGIYAPRYRGRIPLLRPWPKRGTALWSADSSMRYLAPQPIDQVGRISGRPHSSSWNGACENAGLEVPSWLVGQWRRSRFHWYLRFAPTRLHLARSRVLYKHPPLTHSRGGEWQPHPY